MAIRFHRTAWLTALAFWVVFGALMAVGSAADAWIPSIWWAALIVLSAIALWNWRGGQSANLPRAIRRWTEGNEDDARR